MNHPTLSQKSILFFGTPAFAVPALRALHASGASLLCITNPDKAVGRKKVITAPPIKQEAERLGMRMMQPLHINESLIVELRAFQPDVAVLAAYGKIIPPELLTLPKEGFVNVHPSLLPKYRGASPVAGAILAGEKETGVTLMLMDERLDHGPVLAQRSLLLDGLETTGPLTATLAELGASLLMEVLPEYLDGSLRGTSQDDSEATMTHVIKKEEARIGWKNPAAIIERQIRAYHPWPVAWTIFQGSALKIHSARIASVQHSVHTGNLSAEQKRLLVVCGEDTSLEILEVQKEGKQRMSAAEFLHGIIKQLPALLG